MRVSIVCYVLRFVCNRRSPFDFVRYRAAIIQEGGERGELMGGREEGSMESVDEDGDLGVSAFTEEGVSPGPRTEDTFRDRQVR